MGIEGAIKQISLPTLELLRNEPILVGAFYEAKLLPETTFWQRLRKKYNWKVLEQQFLAEWETPELDLHKYWQEITFLLAGYVPVSMASQWTIPELQEAAKKCRKDFLSFSVIPNSRWDGLPLVNAFGAGREIDYEKDYDPVRYLIPSEVAEIFDGLLELSEKGYRDRFIRESQKPEPCLLIDWSDPEMLDWLTDYYNEIVDYYRSAVSQEKALLLYLT